MAARDDDTPSIREIAELTARLRRLSAAGRDADPAERAAFLADKDALIARIEAARTAGPTPRTTRRAGHRRARPASRPGAERSATSTTTERSGPDERPQPDSPAAGPPPTPRTPS